MEIQDSHPGLRLLARMIAKRLLDGQAPEDDRKDSETGLEGRVSPAEVEDRESTPDRNRRRSLDIIRDAADDH